MMIPGRESQILVGIAVFLFGALVTHLWNRYRRRLRRLRWSAEYHRLAVAAEDVAFGKVEVLYNGAPATNLHLGVIQLQNESASDLQDVVVNMACLEGSTIVVSQGALAGSLQNIPFTDEFNQALRNTEQPNLAYLTTHRDYRVPVLNRGATANFALLLHRNDALQPNVTVACDHVGVQLRRQAPAAMFWGVPLVRAQVVGLAASFITAAVLAAMLVSTWVVGLGSWALGVLVLSIGAVIIRGWRAILRLLS